METHPRVLGSLREWFFDFDEGNFRDCGRAEDVAISDPVKNAEAIRKVGNGPIRRHRARTSRGSELRVSDLSAEDKKERYAPKGHRMNARWRPRIGLGRRTGTMSQKGATQLGRGRNGSERSSLSDESGRAENSESAKSVHFSAGSGPRSCRG